MRTTTLLGRRAVVPILLVLAALLLGGSASVGGASVAMGAENAPPRPAHIHQGTCENLDPTPAYPLADLTLTPPESTIATPEAGAAIPAAKSVTTVDVSLSELLARPFIINVHESAAEHGDFLACGASGGEPGANGLAVGLAPHGPHGDFSGVAWLRPEGEQTVVAVFLTEGIMALRVVPAAPLAAIAPEEVAVTLGGTAGEFSISAAQTTFRVGVPYRFVVTNAGQAPHELMIASPMPTVQMSMEGMHHMALGMIDEDDLPPGTTATLDITLTAPAPAGTLEVACHLPAHYEAGMHLPIDVVS